MKLYKVLSVIGIIMIMMGFGFEIVDLNKKVIEQNDVIESQKALIDELAEKSIKLEEENMALWNNYYMNVSNYDGEYYE